MLLHAPTSPGLCRAASLAAVLAFGAATAPPTRAQVEPARGAPESGAAEVSVALEGSWVRNAQLSDDPVERLASHFVEGFVSGWLREFAEDLANRRRSLVIDFAGQDVLVRNAKRENLNVRTDGHARYDSEGNLTTVFLAEDSLEIVTQGTGRAWLWIETIYRRGERLVHLTETQNFSTPEFLFQTVYDHADGKPPPGRPAKVEQGRFVRPAAIRIVPPRRQYRGLLSGPVEVQTLVIDPLIQSVEFFLDGVRAKEARKPPYVARVRLDDPPRPQTLEVRAYTDPGKLAGTDRIILNSLDSAFGVRIAEIRPAGISPGDFVRVTAQLADGREMEDAELLQGAEHRSEIDVQLVQLQVLVVDRDGDPVGELKAEDFEIRESGAWRPAENLHVSDDVPLVLGVAIDSSESMYLVWRQLHDVLRVFFEGALADDDRAFLVDFDHTVRPLQPLTGSRPLLKARLHRLLAQGGTALNDGVLFSLLQFRNEPGRRALIVVTDGDDLHSRSKRAQVTEYAERMGVPIYFIALGWNDPRGPLIKRLSRQTGGRLFRIHPGQSRASLARDMQQVFDRINEDLRHQHVLTYYSEHPPGAGVEPEVRTTRKGLTVKSVLPLEALQ